jgi:hypothetical protein
MKNSGRNSRRRGRKGSKRVSGRHIISYKQRARDRELTTKRRGELAELAFAFKAATRGFHIAKPYGDSERYDFVLGNEQRFWRVQVKSTTTLLNGLYHLNSHRRLQGRAVPYHIGEIDFLAAYIFPEDAFFILPIRLIHGRASLLFAPLGYRTSRARISANLARKSDRRTSAPCCASPPSQPPAFGWQLLQPYREAWSLLRK